jgi:tetratricopeptide (TPR) repeat protein
VQAQPSDIGPYLARGQLYSAKGDYPRAIADFDKVLSIVPDEKNAQQLRQSTLALQAEMTRIHAAPASPTAQLPSPVPATTPSIPVPPPQAGSPQPGSTGASPAKLLADQAKLLIDQRKYAEAIPLLTRALAADPHYDLALRLRFLAYSAAGKPADALKDVKELVELHPTDARCWPPAA